MAHNKPSGLNKTTMDEIALLGFVDEMLAERKDPTITDENKGAVRTALLEEVRNAINTHLVNLLSEHDQVELDKLFVKKAPMQEIDSFFEEKIPNLHIEIAAVLLNFKTAYLANSKEDPDDVKPAPVTKLN